MSAHTVGKSVWSVFLASAALAILLCGCGKDTPNQAPQDQRVDTIVKQSGGDWAKVSQPDRDFLIQQVGHGDEQSAEMDLRARWGRIKGGPPNPGLPPH